MKKFLKVISILTLLIFVRTSFALCAEQVYFYYNDPTGTPLAMSDSTGNVVWRANYLPFGEEMIGLSTVQNNKMFVGKEKDSESGLYYFDARYMDPAAGRFTSIDPKGPINASTGKVDAKYLLNPQRLNRYAYAGNNPYRWIDPNGLEWEWAQAMGVDVEYGQPLGVPSQFALDATIKYSSVVAVSTAEVGAEPVALAASTVAAFALMMDVGYYSQNTTEGGLKALSYAVSEGVANGMVKSIDTAGRKLATGAAADTMATFAADQITNPQPIPSGNTSSQFESIWAAGVTQD